MFTIFKKVRSSLSVFYYMYMLVSHWVQYLSHLKLSVNGATTSPGSGPILLIYWISIGPGPILSYPTVKVWANIINENISTGPENSTHGSLLTLTNWGHSKYRLNKHLFGVCSRKSIHFEHNSCPFHTLFRDLLDFIRVEFNSFGVLPPIRTTQSYRQLLNFLTLSKKMPLKTCKCDIIKFFVLDIGC